jgi:hypothetical protein
MGKGNGVCDRPGISLGASDSAKPELNLGGGVTSVSEIDTTLLLERVEHRWFTKDERVTFQRRKEGWTAFTFSSPVHKAFKEYGLIHQQSSTNSYDHIYFPSLKAARQAVNDVSLEVGLNIDSRLTRQKHISYKIGDLPVHITREETHWRVYVHSARMSTNLKKHFNSRREFNDAWYATGLSTTHYPTRKTAHQAVKNWLAQSITEGK